MCGFSTHEHDGPTLEESDGPTGFDMTQGDFASRIGVSQSHLSAVEHGPNEVGADGLLVSVRNLASRWDCYSVPLDMNREGILKSRPSPVPSSVHSCVLG